MFSPPPRLLSEVLGYHFRDEGLLDRALTHRSAGGRHNERLEFLGDAVLGLVIADRLECDYATADEGHLSRMRATLVRRESLARLARSLQLGDFLQLGAGEVRSGGHLRDSTLADALEAVFGAVYRDGGYQAAREVIERLYETMLAEVDSGSPQKDPKTLLQEHLQGHQQPLPVYELVETTGPVHAPNFRVLCHVGDQTPCEGSGGNRRAAEQEAAQRMLDVLLGLASR